jgi:hypothetical protein
MVRGIFFKLEFPFAHFGTAGVTADHMGGCASSGRCWSQGAFHHC